MGFFFEDKAAAPRAARTSTPRRKDMPVALMREHGCSVCTLNTKCKGKTPKMEATGHEQPLFYLLQETIGEEEDSTGDHFRAQLPKEVYRKFPSGALKEARFNALTNCLGGGEPSSIECCRGRVEADIAKARPLVVLGVGDECLRWATGFTSALTWRGQPIAVNIGGHACWYYPLLTPNYIFRKNKRQTSEYELTLDHDIQDALDFIESLLDGHPGSAAPWLPSKVEQKQGVLILDGNGADDFQRLEAELAWLATQDDVGIDFESNALRPHGVEPHLWSCALGTLERTVAFPLDDPRGWPTEKARQRVWSLLGEWLLESRCHKVAHHLGMEQGWVAHFFGHHAVRKIEWEDTLLAAHTFDERVGTKGLGKQTTLHFGFDVKALSNVDPVKWFDYPLRDGLLYNGLDAKWTCGLWDLIYKPRLARDPQMAREYERKVRLAPTLVLLEHQGVPVDLDYAAEWEVKLKASIRQTGAALGRTPEVKEFVKRFGRPFEQSSDALVLIRDICKRPEVVVTDKDGSRESTDEGVLSSLPAREVPSAPLILEMRGSEKLLSTYIEPVLEGRMTSPVTGLIHAVYSSTIAITGRLACEDPNLQNFPKRKHKEIRGFVTAGPGQLIAPCDYGQIEFRVVGMASDDPAIVEACWTGYDVHKFWAQRLMAIYPEVKDWLISEFGVDGDDDVKLLKTLRQEAKNKWVFPQLFGAHFKSCAKNLQLPDDVAEDLADEFWDTFKATKRWQDRLVANYEKRLYVETLGGRRRRGPMTRQQVINAPIQGTACDIVCEGMDALSEIAYELDRPTLHPRINVHDDLTFFPYEDELEADLEIISVEMCRHRFDWINVPLVVEVSTGKRWHEAKEIKVYRSNEIFNMRNPYA